MIDATKIHQAFMDCLYKESELPVDEDTTVVVDGVAGKFGLHPERLKDQTELVKDALDQLPDEFKEGWTFLNGCMTKDKELWGEQSTVDELFVMASGLNLGHYLMKREMWSVFPGGVPYFQIEGIKT